jgi:hypothetical protein
MFVKSFGVQQIFIFRKTSKNRVGIGLKLIWRIFLVLKIQIHVPNYQLGILLQKFLRSSVFFLNISSVFALWREIPDKNRFT